MTTSTTETPQEGDPVSLTCGYLPNSNGNCPGTAAEGFGRCLAHLEPPQLDEYLSSIRPGGELNVQATAISGALLDRIIYVLNDPEAELTLGDVDFSGSVFSGEANWSGVIFSGKAIFANCTFSGDVNFDEVEFHDWADFSGTTFGGEFSNFGEAIFQGANFENSAFFGEAFFGGVTFKGDARFGLDHGWGPQGSAIFGGNATFGSCTFECNGYFEGAKFCGDVNFNDVVSKEFITFGQAVFENPTNLGPLAAKSFNCDRSIFRKSSLISVAAATVKLNESSFVGGVTMRVRYAEIDCQGVVFGASSTISDSPSFGSESRDVNNFEAEFLSGSTNPSLVSLQGVDVANLLLVDVNMESCRFDGSHHLDKIKMEGVCRFSRPPKGVRIGFTWLPVWAWSRRQVLAEEQLWRSRTAKRSGWADESGEQNPARVQPLHSKQISALYRQLRKSREDSKDGPGAADFYYGEMEMRRQSSAGAGDWIVLHLYWLMSGYGLRAARPLGFLMLLIVGMGGLLYLAGFADPRPTFGISVLYAAESVVSLQVKLANLSSLTWQGEVTRIALRLLGPLLLGLIVLSVRNRVKR